MDYTNNSNGFVLRRGLAYIIDFIIVAVVMFAINNINIINPNAEKYQEASAKQTELIKNANSSEEIQNMMESEEYNNLTYDIARNGVVYTLIHSAILVMYFALFQRATKGQTVGKRLCKIKVVNKDGGQAKIWQLLVRSLFIYSIIGYLVSGIAIMLMSKESFVKFDSVIGLIFTIISYATIITLIFRKDGRGIHDLVVGTKIEDLKYQTASSPELEKQDVVEAEFVEKEKKITIKKTAKKETAKSPKKPVKKGNKSEK